MENSKKWYTSKTLWFNVITIALQTLDIFNTQFIIDPKIYALILGFGNILLRTITNKKITV